MKTACLVTLILLLVGTAYSQRKGSRELGGGVAFWTSSVKDSTITNFDLTGLMAFYFSKDFLFEFEPRLAVRVEEKNSDLFAIVMGNLSKRIFDMASYDRYRRTSYTERQRQNTTAGIYGQVGVGFWADNDNAVQEGKAFTGPAIGIGFGTHSLMGSSTLLRTRFQYTYLFPTPPLYEEARSVFSVIVGFSIITKL